MHADEHEPAVAGRSLLLFGDSLLAKFDMALTATLECHLGDWLVLNCAAGGSNALDGAARAPHLASVSSDAVVFSFGLNDAAQWKQVPLPTFVDALRDTVTRFADRRRIVLLPPLVDEARQPVEHQRSNSTVDEYRAATNDLANSTGVEVIDGEEIARRVRASGSDSHVADGVHMSAATYDELIRVLGDRLAERTLDAPTPLLGERVVVYVLDEQERLLVFAHHGDPTVGVQVPAGSIEAGEDASAAAMREVREETGTECRVEVVLGALDQDMPLRGRYRNHFVLARAAAPSRTWSHVVSGNGTDADLRFDCGFADLALAEVIIGPFQSACIPRLHEHSRIVRSKWKKPMRRIVPFQRVVSKDAARDATNLAGLEQALSTAADPAERLRLMGQIAELHRSLGSSDAVSAARAAVALARELGDGRAEAANLVRLATALQYDDQHLRAVEMFGEVVDRRSDEGFEAYWHFAQQHLGKCLVEMGRLEGARGCFEAALQERQHLGNEGWVESTNRAFDALDGRDALAGGAIPWR